MDYEASLRPSLSPFTSHNDAMDRLMAWHVWQTHDSELDTPDTKQGRVADVVAQKEAEALVGRVKGVRERWERLRRKFDQVRISCLLPS